MLYSIFQYEFGCNREFSLFHVLKSDVRYSCMKDEFISFMQEKYKCWFYFMKYIILCNSHMKMWTQVFLHETWNFIYHFLTSDFRYSSMRCKIFAYFTFQNMFIYILKEMSNFSWFSLGNLCQFSFIKYGILSM